MFICSCAVVAIGNARGEESGQEVKNVIRTVTTLVDIFEHSKLTFSYDTEIGDTGIAFYQAKAIGWADEAGVLGLPSTQELINQSNIISRRTKHFEVSVLTQGTAQAIELTNIENGKIAGKELFRTDGTRFFMSSHENRWDILGSDVLPVATPADVLITIPNIFPSLPIARSMLQGEVTFPEWLQKAVSSKLAIAINDRTIRFAGPLQPAPDNRELRNIVEITLDKNKNIIDSISQWRVWETDDKSWETYSPQEHEMQTVLFTNYKEIAPGLTIPTTISATYFTRWSTVLSNLSDAAKAKVLQVTGMGESERRISVLTHLWSIKDIDLVPSFSEQDFLPPSDETTVVYDYLTESFAE